MKILVKIVGVVYIYFQLISFTLCDINQNSNKNSTQNTENAAELNNTKPANKSTLYGEISDFMEKRGILKDDIVTNSEFETHLRDMFWSQIPENTKERVIFDILIKQIVKDTPATIKVRDLQNIIKEEYLMNKLQEIYSDMMKEMKKQQQEEELLKKKEQEKKEKVKAAEVIDLGEASEGKDDL